MSETAMNWLYLAPVLMATMTALLVMTVDAMGSRRVVPLVGSVGLIGSGVIAIYIGATQVPGPIAHVMQAGDFHSYASGAILLIAGLVVLGDSDRLIESKNGGPVTALIAFAAAASVVLATSIDLLLTILALETVALTGYALVASAGTSRSDEAAIKYVVQGAMVTGLLLFGGGSLFGLYGGSVEYVGLQEVLQRAGVSGPVIFVLATLVSVIAFKMSAFPFHSWAPDVLETSKPGPAAAIASFPKLAMMLAALTLLWGLFPMQSEAWLWMVAAVGAISIVIGNFAALRQESFQRMLAYSGIAQAGYAMASLVAFETSVFGVRLFALSYALATAGAFLVAAVVRRSDSTWDGTVTGMSGLARSHPLLAACSAVFMLSLTGIPLTIGFWGKFWAFFMAADSGWTWLVVVAFLGSVVSFGYYGGVIKAVYLQDRGEQTTGFEPAPKSGVVAVSVLALIIIAGGIFPIVGGFEPLFRILGV